MACVQCQECDKMIDLDYNDEYDFETGLCWDCLEREEDDNRQALT